MYTRTLITGRTSLISGLLVGLLSLQASATEELVVYGGEIAAAAAAQQQEFQSEMQEYLRSLNEQLKTTLEKDLNKVALPKVQIAASTTVTRG
jgi:hypothetical protein